MRVRLTLILLALLALALPAAAIAESRPFLSPMFTSNMVLQRGMADPVWGWTEPGEKVTVQINGETKEAVAASDGKWFVKVGPLPVGGPYKMTVSGPQTVELENILVGDIWVCSGQSNMEMGIGNVNHATEEIAAASNPKIRLFTVTKAIATHPVSTLTGHWEESTPQTVANQGIWGGFSAVGYFFGRDLFNELKVPIGLIHTSWGGTFAEAWTSASALDAMADFRPAVAQVRAIDAEKDQLAKRSHDERMRDWYEKNDPGSAKEKNWADPDLDASSWKEIDQPAAWETAALPDFDGVAWLRREIDLPKIDSEKDLILHLGPIDDQDTTWVNGHLVGGTDNYLASRDYKVPVSALKVGKNVIAVRVLDTGGAGGIYGKPEQLSLEVPDIVAFQLKGQWRIKAGVELAKATPVPMSEENNPNVVTVLYNGMIAPVIPFGIKGAIWYQGESNAGHAYQYRSLLPAMIRDWRNRWGAGEFPFYIVQLANFMETDKEPVESEWAELREAQSLTAATVGHSGIAVAIDIGDTQDIHPKNKQEVGRRLALLALEHTYGRKTESSGPTYKSMKQDGGKIRLQFSNLGGGLVAKDGPLKGFAIAAYDHKFVWADATIEGDSVVVSSPQVASPVAVRYAWGNNPVCNLYNKAGLPAPPFRTDDWPGITQDTK